MDAESQEVVYQSHSRGRHHLHVQLTMNVIGTSTIYTYLMHFLSSKLDIQLSRSLQIWTERNSNFVSEFRSGMVNCM